MTSRSTPAKPTNRTPLLIALGAVAAVVVLLFFVGSFYTDYLWFEQLGFEQVLVTQWLTRALLFLVGFVAMSVPVWLSITLAYRFRPVYAKLNAQLDRYREVVDPLRKLATLGIPAAFGLFAGVAVSAGWEMVLMWLNRTPVAETDPQFGLSLSFYFFELPFWRGVLAVASAVVLICGLVAIATSVLYGSVRLNGREIWVAKAARIQLAVTVAVYVALQGVSIWFDQYVTLTESSNNLFTGAAYTDVNAAIPGKIILASIAVIVALLFVYTAVRGRWRLPVIGTGLLIVSALVVGGLYPWAIQTFQVSPSERTLEQQYLQRNIDATRTAYGVDNDNVEEIAYDAVTDAAPGALREDADTAANIRIIDPALVTDTFAQFEQFRQYYQFPEYLDVDRYRLDGEVTDTVISLRELNQSGIASPSWVNNTAVYTHGYGVVAAAGNQRTVDGQPHFLESGIPVSGKLGKYEPRIYFGEYTPEFSIVGAPKGTTPIELDYPTSEDENADTTTTTFDGDGGPSLSNFIVRLIYAAKFQSPEILLSDVVNEKSQILYDRHPAERVAKVAPYLTLDSDPYPAVVDGRIVWIIDGYTTSASYPYSEVASLQSSITDTYTRAPLYAVDNINYIRNSVKATVDAYDGSVTLFAWDDKDPILQTWQKVFPSTVQPLSEMSAELISHVRYPADLFKMQRTVLGTYHVTNATTFYERNDAWTTPSEPTSTSTTNPPAQPPYYLTMSVPGEETPSFQIYSTFIPEQTNANSRNVLLGYLTANADAGTEAGVKGGNYGKLTLLTLSNDDTVPGPGQVQANFNSDTLVANQLNLLEQGGRTEVLRGNLLTLPVGGGLLYVQPVYVRSTGETSYPLLRKVLVAFGDSIAFEDTLDLALDTLFGGDSGAEAGDGNVDPEKPAKPTDPAEPSDPNAGPSTELDKALADAQQAISDRQAALAREDWTAYGEADARLQAAIERALAASE